MKKRFISAVLAVIMVLGVFTAVPFSVNAKDRMILTRHLAKWQGYENLPF